jgi:VanZ family protein
MVELAQIFISSHAASTTDLILGLAGVAIGTLLARGFLSRSETTGLAPPTRRAAPAVWLIGAWCLVLCAYHWVPYDFVFDQAAIERKLARVSFLPFAGYRSGSDLNALSNLLTKLALAAPLGACAPFAFGFDRRSKSAVIAAIAVAGVIFSAVEMGQFFVPGRVPDPTDILVGIAGAWGGLMVGDWLRSELQTEKRRRDADF